MKQLIQKYTLEFYNAIGGGVLGYIGSKIFETWIQPILITAICAIISLLISHYGKRILERKLPTTMGGGGGSSSVATKRRVPHTK